MAYLRWSHYNMCTRIPPPHRKGKISESIAGLFFFPGEVFPGRKHKHMPIRTPIRTEKIYGDNKTIKKKPVRDPQRKRIVLLCKGRVLVSRRNCREWSVPATWSGSRPQHELLPASPPPGTCAVRHCRCRRWSLRGALPEEDPLTCPRTLTGYEPYQHYYAFILFKNVFQT
jgi:hypothetical protein